ncbi:MAG: outer membrane protein assembly factor BamD [Bacteroidetes bacterium]|nr:outer membrane protein assembly factor BamD [Cryomorphaceae bacterium]MBL6677329.1 outer membrane protein assembly factor BamD [Flavobacteriaceae bacterium]MDA0330376.1 outer membrane protein assembly factor BamD [Bacteroidota bacterium]MDA0884928.1 outer membrane protein assembly factor BamD [Bacteroidota bacterium]MDA1226139.1 outer membrane protein assembly factor BamD [Bacteroidota bacterium]
MYRVFFLVSITFLLLSCNDYQKLLNSTENEVEKYTAAENYYNNGEYRRANALIEQIIPSYRGKPQGERLVYFFANSYFETKLYYSAAIQFENFIKSYPNSQRIQEAYFMEAKSYFMLSPLYSLDQDDTFIAVDKFQVFINRFPNSEYVSEALELMDELQNKLEKKDFEISKQYYTIRDYNSAIKSIDNFIADNPGTIFREEALYYKWLSQYEIAINSIESRIVERVTELERSLDNFLRYYPDTIFIEDLSEKINIAKQLL